jgi:REP element-mobilizing transposase RayT
MTYPRNLLIRPGAAGVFHCVSRCVRRAFLCGVDRASGRTFEHRRQWIEDRVLALCELFAVSLHAYAVMANHFHVVAELVPDEAMAWTESEVAQRWVRLFPVRGGNAEVEELRIQALLANPDRLAVLRRRLCDLGWFMRCLNEPIARRANREDQCKGRFWEGRYKAQALLDDRAVLAAMAYVDLNPIRAGITDRLDRSSHTSIQSRLRRLAASPDAPTQTLLPIAGVRSALHALSEAHYIELVDWTGRELRPGKRGAIPKAAPTALHRLGIRPDRWPLQVKATGSGYWRAIGSAQALLDLAAELGQQWMRGIHVACKLAT